MNKLNRIPATVITGFLGAGKTSMIRHLLQTANGKRLNQVYPVGSCQQDYAFSLIALHKLASIVPVIPLMLAR